MRGDLQTIGFAQTLPRRIAASATRYESGEPLHDPYTLTAGASTNNVFVLAAANTPVLGTHRFGGIAISNAVPFSTGTLVAHTAKASCPIPDLGRIRGKATTAANVDTDAEILLIIGDVTLISYSATGASDGGELYTIIDAATANTSGLEIIAGDPAKQTLDVSVEPRAYRFTVS